VARSDASPYNEETAVALLLERASAIRGLQVEDQRISFDTGEWRRWFDGTYFQSDESAEVFDKVSDGFSRGELFRIASAAAEATYGFVETKKLWLAVYAWGGGIGAMGYRARVNARLAIFDNRFPEKIQATIEKLGANDVAGAYEEIDAIIGAGEGFFTKFLYFVSKPGLCHPLPLIYDEQVRRALQALLGKRWALPLGATMSTSASDIYVLYVNKMHDWAGDIGATPDQLELFLFQKRGNILAEGG
jgi:hypothetical protein